MWHRNFIEKKRLTNGCIISKNPSESTPLGRKLSFTVSLPTYAAVRISFQDNAGFVTPIPSIQTVGAPKPDKPKIDNQITPQAEMAIVLEQPVTHVDSIVLDGNTVLKTEDLQPIFQKYTGKDLSRDDLKTLLSEVNKLYEDKGYVTSFASIPDQETHTSKTLKLEATEGKIGDIKIEGNHFNRTWAIDRVVKAQGEKTRQVFNLNAQPTGRVYFGIRSDMISQAYR